MKRFFLRSLLLLLALCATRGAFAQDQTPTPATRTGWSPQARDATIGGAAGLLGGLLINGRNRKVGGLIGGLAGAGAGYVLGQHQANQRKAAAAQAAEQAAANEQAAAEAQQAAAETQQAAAQASQQTAANSQAQAVAAKAQAAKARVQAARLATQRARAARAKAEQQVAASQRALDSQARGQEPATTDLAVAAGFLPNPTMGQAGTPYPFSAVLRKSW